MGFPPDIITRPRTFGGASGLETGTSLSISVTVKAVLIGGLDDDLIWADTGWMWPSTGVTVAGEPGVGVTANLPVTDLPGWRSRKLGGLIDVSAPNSYSHRYVATITISDGGRPIRQWPTEPFIMPTGDLTPIDHDTSVTATSVQGGVVSIPDTWGPIVAEAQAAADQATAVTADITTAGHALTSAPDVATQRLTLGADTGMRKLARRLNIGSGGQVCLIGDSTGNDASDWFYLLGEWIAARYPALSVAHAPFSETSGDYIAPTFIQTGPAGAARVTVGSVRGPWTNIAPAVFPDSDVDIAVRATLPDWTPAANTTLLSQAAGAGQRAFQFTVMASTGVLRYTPYSDGTNVPSTGSFTSTAPPAVVDGQPRWIRFTLDSDDGAGNAVGTFWDGGGNKTPIWTQIGNPVVQTGPHVTNRPAGIPYMCGATNGAQVAAGGIFYNALIRAGIGGPLVADPVVARWTNNPDSSTVAGSPVLTLWNGSIPGRNIGYLSDPARFGMLLPLVAGIDTVILSSCHNENTGGVEWISDYARMLSLIGDRAPQASLIGCVQNPQTSVNMSGFVQHNARLAELRQFLEDNRAAGCLDALAAFEATGDPAAYIGSDGIHPTPGDAGGSGLWRDAAVANLEPLLD